MHYRTSKKLKGWLINVVAYLAGAGLLLLVLEIALSILVYRERVRVEPAFCSKKFAFTANCTDPSPLFHLRLAGLAFYNAVALKQGYRARRFEDLNENEKQSLEFWKTRKSRVDPLPWDPKNFTEYNYDSRGRRVSSSRAAGEKSKLKYLVFFGGSWVHGDWLPYEQTLTGQIEKEMPAYRVYNYGIQGGGLQEIFLGIHNPDFERGIVEKGGIYVYVHNWMHMDRLRPSVAYVAGRFDYPMADYFDGKKLGFGGTFYEGYPVMTPALSFLHHSGIGKLVNLTWKMIPRWDVGRLYCDMLVQTRDRLESVNASAKFVVLVYGKEAPGDDWKFPIRCLEQNKIPYFAPFFDGSQRETYLPDGHPDAETHRKVVGPFVRWIGSFAKP